MSTPTTLADLVETAGEPGARLVELLLTLLPPSTDSDDLDRLALPLLRLLIDEIGAGYAHGWAACQTQHEAWSGVARTPKTPCAHCGTDALKCAIQPHACCRSCFHQEKP